MKVKPTIGSFIKRWLETLLTTTPVARLLARKPLRNFLLKTHLGTRLWLLSLNRVFLKK